MSDQATYILEAHIPYERPDTLFSGYEEDMKAFINRNLTHHKNGRKIAGYWLYYLSVTIEGPDVETYIINTGELT